MIFEVTVEALRVQAHYRFQKPLADVCRVATNYNVARKRHAQALEALAEADRIAELASELSDKLPESTVEQAARQPENARMDVQGAAESLRSIGALLFDAAGDQTPAVLDVVEWLQDRHQLSAVNVERALRARMDGEELELNRLGGDELAETS
jgi:hypothetical protein